MNLCDRLFLSFLLFLLLMAAVVPFVILRPPPAAASGHCDTHDKIVERIEGGYQEARIWRGLAGAHVIELFEAENGDWSLVRTTAYGQACIFGFGVNSELISPARPQVKS